jgi:hypothetical protein
MKALTVIRNLKKKHFISVKPTQEIESLVRYALHIGYSDGWRDCKTMLRTKKCFTTVKPAPVSSHIFSDASSGIEPLFELAHLRKVETDHKKTLKP